MSRVLDRIRALWADAQAWLAAASPRERRLVLLAAGGVLLFAVLIAWASFTAAIRRADSARRMAAVKLAQTMSTTKSRTPPAAMSTNRRSRGVAAASHAWASAHRARMRSSTRSITRLPRFRPSTYTETRR